MRSAIIALVIGLFSHVAMAKDGSSGCGPGWYILKDNSLVSSFLRAVTNGVLSPVYTLGMTFGTSNCAKHSIVDAEKRSEHLAMVGFEKLRQDVAKGEGPFLDAYAETFKCDQHGAPQFKQSLQANFTTVFSDNASPKTIVENTKMVVKTHPEIAQHCLAS